MQVHPVITEIAQNTERIKNPYDEVSKACRHYLAVIWILGLIVWILLILLLKVYKKKTPVIMVDALVLRDMNLAQNVSKVSVDVYLSVNNPNKVVFKYANITAVLIYMDRVGVGEALMGAGEISAGKTKAMNFTLTAASADGLVGNSEVHPEVLAGTLPFNTDFTICGKVTFLKILKVDAVSTRSRF